MATSPSAAVLSNDEPPSSFVSNSASASTMAASLNPITPIPSSEIPSLHTQSTQVPTQTGIPPLGTEVDTALLSAMRDPRERVALLKLERVFVDWLKQPAPQRGEEGDGAAVVVDRIDVGGAYNSMVVGFPTTTTTKPTTNTMAVTLLQQQQQQRPSSSTSFQRCWLHRLADRFQIVREMSTIPDCIACVRTASSRIPPKLLIDMEPHEYSLLEEGMSYVSLQNNPKPKRKMKIMKRNSSGALQHTSDRNLNRSSSSGRTANNGLKGKNLSDKEKAYAEARARIFNESSNSLASDNNNNNTSGGGACANGDGDSHTNYPTTDGGDSPAAGNGSSVPPSLQPSQLVSSASMVSKKSSAQEELSPRTIGSGSAIADTTTASAAALAVAQRENIRNRPKAATMGGVSKVTWRNRQQEENDPDFQRGVYAPTTDAAQYGAGGGGGVTYYSHHQPQQYYLTSAASTTSAPTAGAPQGYEPHYSQSSQQQQQYSQQQYSQTQYYHHHHPPYHHHHHHQQQQQQQYYNSSSGGRGWGRSNRSFNNSSNSSGGRVSNNGRGLYKPRANVNSMDDFPALK